VSPPAEQDEDNLDAGVDPDGTHRYRRVLDLVDPDAQNPGRAERLLLTPTGEPSTLAEAEGDEAWRLAMVDELASIEQNSTWTLVDLPTGHRPIGLKVGLQAEERRQRHHPQAQGQARCKGLRPAAGDRLR
jgi:hypothetical protein